MVDLRAYQPAFTAGELSPALWARVDLSKYQTGLKAGRNLFIHPHGGASNRAGTEFIHEVRSSAVPSRLIPFQFNDDQTYVLEFTTNIMRVYKNGAVVLSGGLPYELATTYQAAHLRDLVFTQEADVMYITHPDYPPRKLGRLADNNWTITTVTFGPKIAAPGTPTAVALVWTGGNPDYVAKFYQYRVAAVSEDGDESLPSPESNTVINDLTLSGGLNRITWPAVAGAARYIVYKEDSGIYGYIGGTTGTQFDDQNITADLGDTPQTARNPFNGVGNYPRCSTFVEQRLAFASTRLNPQAVWLSQSANYENFGTAQPAKASDAVTFRLRGRKVHEIRAMLPSRGLMLLTSGGEWVVSGGSTSDAISPSAIKVDIQGYRGAAKVQPVEVGDTILFAQGRGGVVRDFSYEFASDKFLGRDLTILARHLFEGRTIVAWGYAQAPSSVVWVVLDNGRLISMTYMREHEVWAWTPHYSTGGFFEDVTVVAEGNEDVPYFIVRRTINGQTKRYIERLHSRAFTDVKDAFFVDCGLTYTGAAATVISGLGHLEGQSVVALADGNVVRGLTVSGGAVTLPNAATKVHIGLGMEAALGTLDLDLGNVPGLGTTQGRKKSVSNVVLRVENTRGIFTGPRDAGRDSPHMVEYKQRATEAWNEPIGLYTGDIHITPPPDWTDGGSVWIKQFDPLPMTILAIMPDITIGG